MHARTSTCACSHISPCSHCTSHDLMHARACTLQRARWNTQWRDCRSQALLCNFEIRSLPCIRSCSRLDKAHHSVKSITYLCRVGRSGPGAGRPLQDRTDRPRWPWRCMSAAAWSVMIPFGCGWAVACSCEHGVRCGMVVVVS